MIVIVIEAAGRQDGKKSGSLSIELRMCVLRIQLAESGENGERGGGGRRNNTVLRQ